MNEVELIIMGANPADADLTLEELLTRQRRQEERRLANLDCSIDGRGLYLTGAVGRSATKEVAPVVETEVE